jgi:hypothetical protein
MRTLGSDLVADPKKTAAAGLEWPGAKQVEAARQKGWIHLPSCPLGDLLAF